MSTTKYSSPGRVRMSCMLWEPNPIPQRCRQEYSVIYNDTTLQKLPDFIQSQTEGLSVDPGGIYLKPKYVYRDTFLVIGASTLNSARPDMRAENGTDLFIAGVPQYEYIEHQTFVLDGSLFNDNTATATGIAQATQPSFLDASAPVFQMTEIDVPFETDGHNDIDADDSNDHNYIDAIDRYTTDSDFQTKLTAATLTDSTVNGITLTSDQLKAQINARATRRFMPIQLRVSSDQKTLNGGTPQSGPPVGIHWLVTKQTPMFQGEDFFVEFIRPAGGAIDVVNGGKALKYSYRQLDSLFGNTYSENSPPGVPVNGGVVQTDIDGTLQTDSQQQFNFNSQPYYIIEMGVNDPHYNYFIILAYNAKPIFVRRGMFKVIQPKTATESEAIVLSKVPLTQRLSFYNISSKALMDRQNLRITVRNHLSHLVIIFEGYEDNPWIITQQDFKAEPTPTTTTTTTEPESGETVSDTEPIKGAFIDKTLLTTPMIVAGKQIKIGAGNLPCGFTFGPLHYAEYVYWAQPEPITVKGPLKLTDISLLLSDPSKTTPMYFQDAEVFIEYVKGVENKPVLKVAVGSTTSNSPHLAKAPGKDENIIDFDDFTNKDGLQVSVLAVNMYSKKLESIEPSDGSVIGNVLVKDFIQQFDVSYLMQAGDVNLPCPYASGTATPANPTSPPNPTGEKWRLWNCITPIAIGWRLYIPQDTIGHGQTPVEVAQHVERFNHTWNYTDESKIEHNGTIKFNINAGQALSFQTNTQHTVDQTPYLETLTDKAVWIRIYAWWEGGFMDCNNCVASDCACTKPGGAGYGATDGDKHCIFTGLMWGGDVTVEGNFRSMECQLTDYMKILEDQPFVNSPFFDGMADYSAISKIVQLANLSNVTLANDPYAPSGLIEQVGNLAWPPGADWTIFDPITNESLFYSEYTLPSSFDLLQSPFFKFRDLSKYTEAINQISSRASKVAFFDRFGRFRLEVRPDNRFDNPLAKFSRIPKCNFMTSQYYVTCTNLNLLAYDTYTYKRSIMDMANELFFATSTPEGAILQNSVINYPGRYDPTSTGFIGYHKAFVQFDGIFGSETALNAATRYYVRTIFNAPINVSWKALGVPNLQAADIVTFTAIGDDTAFPASNIEVGNQLTQTPLPNKTATLIITSISGEIDATNNTWWNNYEGEWFSGDISTIVAESASQSPG
jgi:hypothetical protein